MAQQGRAVGAEDAFVEERLDAGEELVFAHVHRAGVVGVFLGFADEVEFGLAGVVAVALAGLAEHPFVALLVVHERAQYVGAVGVGVGVLHAHPRPLAGGAVLLDRVPHRAGDEGFVGGLR
ncbi:hypothetical protein [Nocardia farcinica]|uniref:hypothetical protein n=1 Tax=Nocardia farcinica TaxID=37329 RepID=UPI001893D009|nr:hypothetical protein [Nocardia farcinica]UAK33266.1 hypothetical protein K8O92_04560 [Nocardia asteroides]MBF6234559.1 hypothetical protein [Nocardia farcinica]MBF6256435.1 hypothetical protein [Nocardia farcinica]MBF6269164.1 hypothetical protein [Nocardia farcinica]MBF6445636.1 hypothetical protein [Nocardia farcinica]